MKLKLGDCFGDRGAHFFSKTFNISEFARRNSKIPSEFISFLSAFFCFAKYYLQNHFAADIVGLVEYCYTKKIFIISDLN